MIKILVTGASSYVGARIYFDLKDKFEVVGTYNDTKLSDKLLQLDTTNSDSVHTLVNEVKPNIIVHAAANASGKWCEEHPKEAIALNQTATKYIVEAANELKAKTIFISSFAAEDLSSLYGRTKNESERTIKEATNNYIILRPSLVIGFSPNTENDRPFNRFLKNIDQGTPAIYDTSWEFQPTYLGHLSEVINTAIEKDLTKEVIPVAVKELKSRYDVAKDLLTPFGISVSPEDKKDKTPVIINGLKKLKELSLPTYNYQQIIVLIINEIKNRDRFKL